LDIDTAIDVDRAKPLLKTTDCATLLSLSYGGTNGFDDVFVRRQITDGLLRPRVNWRGPNRKRAKILVHPDELRVYVAEHHDVVLRMFDQVLSQWMARQRGTFHGER